MLIKPRQPATGEGGGKPEKEIAMAKWICQCGHEFGAPKGENAFCPQCGELAFPKANMRRVHGDQYEPYAPHTLWDVRANESLRRAAQDNFMRRR